MNNNNSESVVAIDGLTFPLRLEHKGNSYDLSLVARRVGDPASTLSVMIRLDPRTATLNGRPGVPVSELRASGVNPPALTWGHKSFEAAWREGDFTVVVPGQQPGKPVPASSAGKELAMLLERIEWTNNLLLANGAARCTRIGLEPIHSLFVGVQPAALVFCHRGIEKHGDYLRLGTLAYDTLEWRAEWPCAGALGDPLDPAIRAEIEEQVASMRAKAGQDYQISSSGQTVRLGSKRTTAEALKNFAHDLATVNPGLTFAYDASGVYSLHGDKIIMAMSKAITGEIVDLCDSPRDVTQYVKREGLTVLPVVASAKPALRDVTAAWDERGIEHAVHEKNGLITLDKIRIPNESRNLGLGTRAMEELVRYADSVGATIALTPSLDFGATSLSRLGQFYEQFGFVENKGRYKDFTISEGMIRLPVAVVVSEVNDAPLPVGAPAGKPKAF